jgi:hypothetical protein
VVVHLGTGVGQWVKWSRMMKDRILPDLVRGVISKGKSEDLNFGSEASGDIDTVFPLITERA